MSPEKIRKYIDDNVQAHRETDDEDLWTAEIIEYEIFDQIFRYAVSIDCKVEGLDLKAIVEAEDDDDPAVPGANRYEVFMDLRRRMDPDAREHLEFPNVIKELFDYFERTFWPHNFEEEED